MFEMKQALTIVLILATIPILVGSAQRKGTHPMGLVEPLLIDLGANGFHLTSLKDGVRFDLTGDGDRRQMAWTEAGSDDAFLALDVTRTGRVEDGRKLLV